jgi:hypothetical protein
MIEGLAGKPLQRGLGADICIGFCLHGEHVAVRDPYFFDTIATTVTTVSPFALLPNYYGEKCFWNLGEFSVCLRATV